MTATIIPINQRRRLPCPHCDATMQIRHLITHIDRDECPALMAKKHRHPSNGNVS